jgi:eukaryotic-like serine/threonine-protein kinase
MPRSIDRSRWAELSPQLDALLDLPEAERVAHLAALRLREPQLADDLQALLAREAALDACGFMAATALPPPPGPNALAGQTLGAYTLERELGRGGMGQVWLARRNDGRYDGQVAIKLLQGGLFSHGDAARFEREGRILARLDQPHIARLLDAGVGDDGRQPYLVLEYVDGVPIDRHVADRALGVNACLRLMIDAADAVAHAHARLILHRDLKPSNMLVRADGQLKLLDFGIAKLLDDQAGGAPGDLTQQAGTLFTPTYAAPEQLQGEDVTTATDVYALGVLLYGLLGGGHPTAQGLTTAVERLRAAVEFEPRRLSDQVLRLGGPGASQRARALRGDVDTIVAKALRKAPAERYANAAELAEDLRRSLAHQPIRARPDRWMYRSGRFVRRHRLGVAAASVTLLAVLGGSGVAVLEAREARAQRAQAEGLLEFMLGDLRKRLQPVGRLDALDAVGERVLAYYAAQDAGRLDADALARRARALHLIGEIADRRGQTSEARRRFAEAARSTAELLSRTPGDPQRLFDHAQSEFWVSQAAWRGGEFEAARLGFERYRALALQLRRIDPQRVDWQREEAYAEQNLGVLAFEQQQPQAALDALLRARQLFSALAATDPGARKELSTNLGWIARAQEDLGQLDAALATVAAKRALLRPRDNGVDDRPEQYQTGLSHNDRARLLLMLGRPEASLADAAQAVDWLQPLVTLDPSNRVWQTGLAFAEVAQAEALLALGRTVEARRALQAAARASDALRKAAVASDLRDLSLRARWVTALAAADPAAAHATAMAAELDHALAGDPDAKSLRSTRRHALVTLALALGDELAASGQPAAAQQRWQQAERALGTPGAEPMALALHGQLAQRLGRSQDAAIAAERLLTGPARHPQVLDLLARLGLSRRLEGTR